MEVLKLKYVRRLRRYHITSGSIILPEVLPYLRTSVRRFSIFEGTFVLPYFRSCTRTKVSCYCRTTINVCLFAQYFRKVCTKVLCTTVHVHVLYHICYLRRQFNLLAGFFSNYVQYVVEDYDRLPYEGTVTVVVLHVIRKKIP